VDEEWQPMALAAAHGHEQVVKLFLDLGLDPCRKEGWRPLTEEFQNQEEADEEGNPNMDYKHESDPLSLAITHGFENVARLLITHGAMKDWNTQNAADAMYLAVTGGHLALVKLLAGLFPESINGASRQSTSSPLSLAIYKNELEIVRLLTSLGADLNAACRRKISPLGWAAIQGDFKVINFLVDNGACPDPMMSYGATLWPLRWAAEQEEYDAVDYLLSKIDVKAKISMGGEDLTILLLVAALCGLESLLREILASGCDANSICDHGYPNFSCWPRPALSAAAQTGRVDIATILLEQGASLYGEEDEYMDYDPEYQPLFSACRGGHIEVVKLLFDHGLDLRKAETKDKSAVIAAMGFPQIIDLLLSRGADGQAQSHGDRANPMPKAVSSGHIASIQVLLDHNVPVKPSVFFALNQSLIREASKAEDGPAVLNLLAVHGGITLAENRDTQPVLRETIQRGSAEVTEFFLKRGFDPNFKWDGHPLYSRSYLEDALNAKDLEDAEATISVLLRYGADIRDLQGYQHNLL
jgi:ankyrin repeat protein